MRNFPSFIVWVRRILIILAFGTTAASYAQNIGACTGPNNTDYSSTITTAMIQSNGTMGGDYGLLADYDIGNGAPPANPQNLANMAFHNFDDSLGGQYPLGFVFANDNLDDATGYTTAPTSPSSSHQYQFGVSTNLAAGSNCTIEILDVAVNANMSYEILFNGQVIDPSTWTGSGVINMSTLGNDNVNSYEFAAFTVRPYDPTGTANEFIINSIDVNTQIICDGIVIDACTGTPEPTAALLGLVTASGLLLRRKR